MQFSQYQFRFSLLGTIMAILGTVLFSSLGTWQVHRAKEKQDLQQEIDSRQHQPVFSVNQYNGDITRKMFSPVTATGHFDKQHEILVDNEVYKGKAGYHVLTPLKLQYSNKVILVNRGWVSIGTSRNILPEIKTPSGLITITGTINPFKSRPALILDDSNDTGKVWPFFDYEKYKKYTGYHLMPAIIQMSNQDPHGFIRDWPQYDSRVSMHIGYSIQWFAFAVIVVVTYLGLNIKKKQV